MQLLGLILHQKVNLDSKNNSQKVVHTVRSDWSFSIIFRKLWTVWSYFNEVSDIEHNGVLKARSLSTRPSSFDLWDCSVENEPFILAIRSVLVLLTIQFHTSPSTLDLPLLSMAFYSRLGPLYWISAETRCGNAFSYFKIDPTAMKIDCDQTSNGGSTCNVKCLDKKFKPTQEVVKCIPRKRRGKFAPKKANIRCTIPASQNGLTLILTKIYTDWVTRDGISTELNPYELMWIFLFDIPSLGTQSV